MIHTIFLNIHKYENILFYFFLFFFFIYFFIFFINKYIYILNYEIIK